MAFDYEEYLKEVHDSMTEEQKANIARIKRTIEENNRILEAEYNKANPRYNGKTVDEYILGNCVNKPWHAKYTRAEWEKAMELWQLMKKLNKLVK